MKNLSYIGRVLIGLALPLSAFAATDTADLVVTADVTNTCTIEDAAMAFGAYDSTSATALDASAVLTLNCTLDAPAQITMGEGSNPEGGSSAAVPLRQMISGADLLPYTLYQEAAHTNVWGNDATSDVDYVGTGASDVTVLVYGSIAAGELAPAGSYLDTVVMTITF